MTMRNAIVCCASIQISRVNQHIPLIVADVVFFLDFCDGHIVIRALPAFACLLHLPNFPFGGCELHLNFYVCHFDVCVKQ